MVFACAISLCHSRYSAGCGITFHALPIKDHDLRQKWLAAIALHCHKPQQCRSICSRHFRDTDYHVTPLCSRLKPDAIPSVFVDETRKDVTKMDHCYCAAKMECDQAQQNPSMETDQQVPLLEADVTNNAHELCQIAAQRSCDVLQVVPAVAIPPAAIPPAVIHGDHTLKCSSSKAELRMKIKCLQRRLGRSKKTVMKMSALIKNLKRDSQLNAEAALTLNSNLSEVGKEIFKSEMKNHNRDSIGRRYSDAMKKFALTLHFYSPRAYEFLRTVINLPSARAIANWTSSVNCDPGFFIDVFKDLEKKSKIDPFYKDAALMIDGMSIKSSTVYSSTAGRYEGFVDYGPHIIHKHDKKLATETLVFMLVGLRGHWKYPIGYFLCDKVTSDHLRQLISTCLEIAAERSINIVTVTMDGAAANFDAMRQLGCEFESSKETISSSFSHPSSKANLFFIPDAYHMLKLARNALASFKVFIDGQGRRIKWDHICNLHALQSAEGLKFANKLSNQHMEFERHKMNVRIAAQTLSSSVADAITFLQAAHHPGFADCEGTVVFIRTIDRLFDLLNSRSLYGKGFKQPLSLSNRSCWLDVIEKSIDYLLSLTDERKIPLINGRRRTFVVGLILCCLGTKGVADMLLSREVEPFKYILTYKMSQDHLELLFACIRGKNGFNNNPDVVQLRSSLRRILLRNAVVSSKYANCTPFDAQSVGSVYSLKWSKRCSPVMETVSTEEHDDTDCNLLFAQLDSFTLTAYQENIITYIAGFVLRKVMKKISCAVCASALIEQDLSISSPTNLDLIVSKNRGGLVIPSQSVIKILACSEKAFRVAVTGCDSGDKISSNARLLSLLTAAIHRQLLDAPVFLSLNDHDLSHDLATEDMHSTQLQKKIVAKYLSIRLHTYGKHYTKSVIQKSKEGVRQQHNKLVLFSHL